MYESGLLQEIVLLKGHVMTLKKCDHEIKVKVKLKTKIGNLNILNGSHAVC
jgi:hypothetical protein